MQKIIELDPLLISKIAAGEVVQGVYSVIKELVENSLDAGSERIEVSLTGGGLDSIIVSDNGYGIPQNELSIALNRFTTSKIKTLQSLEKIRTYGFRGEALYSIAAVSKFEIISKVKSKDAYCLKRFGEKTEDISICAGTDGTIVIVEDLFYNMPARRKFIKSPLSEKLKAKKTFFSLTLTKLNAEFIWNESEKDSIVFLKDQTLLERVNKIIKTEVSDYLIPFDRTVGGIRYHGVLGDVAIASKRPFNQILVNNRLVNDRALTAAIKQGYGTLLEGKYPVFVLYIDIDPELTDVNIHPSKDEIKISSISYIFSNIKKITNDILKGGYSNFFDFTPSKRIDYRKSEILDVKTNNKILTLFDNIEPFENSKGEEINIDTNYIQIHNTYIISETKDGILIIDQHASAERVLYEEILKNKDMSIQKLLFPIVVQLTEDQWNKVETTKGERFFKLGFHIKIFSESVIVEGVPTGIEYLSNEEIETLVRDIIVCEEDEKTLNKTAAMVACKTSIKAGNELSKEEIKKLIGRLLLCDKPFICPHGRPTMFRLKLSEIEKRIGRKG